MYETHVEGDIKTHCSKAPSEPSPLALESLNNAAREFGTADVEFRSKVPSPVPFAVSRAGSASANHTVSPSNSKVTASSVCTPNGARDHVCANPENTGSRPMAFCMSAALRSPATETSAYRCVCRRAEVAMVAMRPRTKESEAARKVRARKKRRKIDQGRVLCYSKRTARPETIRRRTHMEDAHACSHLAEASDRTEAESQRKGFANPANRAGVHSSTVPSPRHYFPYSRV